MARRGLIALLLVVAAGAAGPAGASTTHRCAARHVDGILITRLKTNAKCAAVEAIARAIFRTQADGCQGQCKVTARHRVWSCVGRWETGTAPADNTARLGISCARGPGGTRPVQVNFSYRRLRGSAD